MGSNIGGLIKNVLTLGAYGQKEAQKEASTAQALAEMEARRIAASKKPMEEIATMLTPATQTDALGSLGLLIESDPTKRKRSTGLGTGTAPVGLGFGS